MRFLLVNDTSKTSNPGCQATVSSLLNLYRANGNQAEGRIWVSEGYDYFVRLAESVANTPWQESAPADGGATDRLSISPTHFRHSDGVHGPKVRRFSDWIHALPRSFRRGFRSDDSLPAPMELFETAVDELSKRHRERFQCCDFVLINGEGTLHHDRVAAYALLGWAVLAKRCRLPVAVVNCTIESFCPLFWDLFGRHVDYLAVREPCSYKYVRPFFPQARLAADAIFGDAEMLMKAGRQNGNAGRRRGANHRVCYSPGALTYEGVVNGRTVANHLRALRDQFDDVSYLTAEVEDEAFEGVALDLDCGVLRRGAVNGGNVIAELSSFDLLVSGRYHLCIFSLLAGVPVVPLQSNTWKMQGLINMGRRTIEPLPHCRPLPTRARHQTGAASWENHSLHPADYDFVDLAARARRNFAPFGSANSSGL